MTGNTADDTPMLQASAVFDWPELVILAVQSLRLAWRRGRSGNWPIGAAQYRSILCICSFELSGERLSPGSLHCAGRARRLLAKGARRKKRPAPVGMTTGV